MSKEASSSVDQPVRTGRAGTLPASAVPDHGSGLGVARYVAARLGWGVLLVLVVIIVNFVLTHVLSGSPITALTGNYPVPTGYQAQIKEQFGLDKPLWVQLWLYLVSLAHGNLGFSFASQQPVLPLILGHAVFTLLLMIPALIVATVVGILLGSLASRSPGSLTDTLVSAGSIGGYSIPVFWLAQLLILLFAVVLGVLPAQGIVSVTAGTTPSVVSTVGDYLVHLVLPGTTVALYYLAVVARVSRASLIQTSNSQFAILALSKGVTSRRVFWRHKLRNSLLPIVTVIGYNFGYALTGAILTETVFGWPGVGALFITSITNRDYPVIEGIFLLSAIGIVAANLITDLVYMLLDPRVARSYQGQR